MKQPTAEQINDLRRINPNSHSVAYLKQLEAEYIQKLVGAEDMVIVHKLQGSIESIQFLLKLILNEKR